MWKVVETFFSKSLSHSRPFRGCVRIFVDSINFSKSNIANSICRSSDPNVEVCLASRPPLHQLAPVSRHMSKASAGARQAAHNTPGGAGLCSQHRFYMIQNMSDTLQIQYNDTMSTVLLSWAALIEQSKGECQAPYSQHHFWTRRYFDTPYVCIIVLYSTFWHHTHHICVL